MGIFDIIGAAILLAVLIAFCLCCTRACQRKKRPENRRKRRRQQKNSRRKRRRQQRNSPATNPQTRIQIENPASQPPTQQQHTNAPIASVPPPGYQTISPHQQYPISSPQGHLQFHNQQYPNLLAQPQQNQQFVFAQQQQLPHMTAQQADLYPFPPPPYEPPEQSSTQRQLETRIAIPGMDINQFARPPPPPYDEELQKSEPFKLN